MELRKKSILIALCLGDGYITHQRQLKKGKYYQYNYLEVSHGASQKDYIEWKLNVDVFKLEKKIKRETQEREYFL